MQQIQYTKCGNGSFRGNMTPFLILIHRRLKEYRTCEPEAEAVKHMDKLNDQVGYCTDVVRENGLYLACFMHA